MNVTFGSSMPTEAVIVDWWAPPSGASVTPDGAGHDEPRAGVDRVDEGVQAAQHERVVDGAHRQQRLIGQIPGQAELPEQQEQVHLADAELDVLPVRTLGPLQHRVVAPGPLRDRAEHPGPVDEAGQVRGRRHIRRGRHQVRRDRLGSGTGRPGSGRTPPGWRWAWLRAARWHRGRRPRSRLRTGRPGQMLAAGGCPLPGRCHRVEPVPLGRRRSGLAARASGRPGWWTAAPSGCAGCRRSAGPSP